jgi:ethanolamine utilization protein EutQ (cupin superfamily)
MEYKVDFKSLPWALPMRGVRHKELVFGDRKLRLVEYSDKMESHWCERGHSGYILDGQIEIEFSDGVQTFKAGDGINIPGGSQYKHKARVLSGIVRAFFIEDA